MNTNLKFNSMNTNLKFIGALLLGVSLSLTSCKKENEGDGGDKGPIKFEAEVSANSVDVGKSLTFTDKSTGVTSRTWTFPLGTPNSSPDANVDVTFPHEGPVVAKLEVTFHDGRKQIKDFPIQVGKEKYSRLIFGFEGSSELDNINSQEGATWKKWSASGNASDITVSVDKTQGVNNTPSCLKVVLNKTGVESQIFTKENENLPINAELESNKTYTFSFYIKGDVESITAGQLENLQVIDGNETQAWKGFVWISPVWVSDEWVKISQVFTTDDLSTAYTGGKALNVFTQFKFIPDATGTVYIDEISLKEGDFGNNNPEPLKFVEPVQSSAKIAKGGEVTFTDKSLGVKSRTWTFNGGAPNSSTEREQKVTYATIGNHTGTLEVTLNDNSTKTYNFSVEVVSSITGTELYNQDIFGFEGADPLTDNWTLWNSSGGTEVTMAVAGGGASGTSKALKISFNGIPTGKETQLLTRDAMGINASLTAGKSYEFSFWAKADGVDVSAAEIFVGDNDPWTQYYWTNADFPSGTGWVKFVTTFQAQDPFDATKADNVYPQLKFLPSIGTGDLYLDNFSILELD